MTAASRSGSELSVSVVVCAYTMRRWQDLRDAYESLLSQTRAPQEIVVVIDHNPELLDRARDELTSAQVLPNHGVQGLSDARNTGVSACSADVVLFLDDDAVAAADWVEQLSAPFSDPQVVGVGGWADPGWDEPGRPPWFPDTFLWVVGCSYEGLPREIAEIRNPIGCAMGFRRSALLAVGGFSSAVGRVGTLPVGCEETELSIRIRQTRPGARILQVPAAVVQHRVTADRRQLRYFLRRCYFEGLSKAAVSARVGRRDSLSSESSYASRVLPRAVAQALGDLRQGDRWGLARASAIVIGLAVTVAGYLVGRSRTRGAAEAVVDADRPPLPSYVPVWCTQLELASALPPLLRAPDLAYGRARVLLRLHGDPVGFVHLPLTGGTAAIGDVMQMVSGEVWDAARAHLAGEDLEAPALEDLTEARSWPQPTTLCRTRPRTGPSITVVVCTRNRPEQLSHCLAGLGALTYGDLEVVVVDNAPSDDATHSVFQEAVGQDSRFRYVIEPRPGLSCARNRGLEAALGEFIAYTDDDVSVDEVWVDGLVRGFARRSDVDCVTGLVCTKSLDSAAESYFDARVTWGGSCSARIFDMRDSAGDALFPYSPGIFGTGANMAFRSSTLRALGGFDEALGAGTRTGGGEDLDIFVRLLQSGAALAYEPSAVVWHAHRADYAALGRQMWAYGTGLSAFLTKHLLDTRTRSAVLRRIPGGVSRLLHVPGATKHSLGPATVPPSRSLLLRELGGFSVGPLAYVQARRSALPGPAPR